MKFSPTIALTQGFFFSKLDITVLTFPWAPSHFSGKNPNLCIWSLLGRMYTWRVFWEGQGLSIKLMYRQPVCRNNWNHVRFDKRREGTLCHNAQCHLGQTKDWIICESLATSTCMVWHNITYFPAFVRAVYGISSILSIR